MVGVTATAIETRPTRLGIGLTGLFAIVAVLATVIPLALIPNLIGTLLVVAGTVRGTRAIVTVGAGGLVIGVIVAGLAGVEPEPLLIATAAAVLAWDAGMQAIDLGETLGRTADTSRALVVHVAASTITAAVIAGLGYAVYRIVGSGQPVTALVLLLFGAIVLSAAFRG